MVEHGELYLVCDECDKCEAVEVVQEGGASRETAFGLAIFRSGWHYWDDENVTMCNECQLAGQLS